MVEGDIIRVIKEYAEIDEKGLDIKLTRMKREIDNLPMSALVANIPIIKIKEMGEIENNNYYICPVAHI